MDKPMHNKTKHKLILKPMTNELSETKSRHKKTCKMKGGFFGIFSKTPVAGPISASTEPTVTTASTITKTSAVVGVITSLATMASDSLANPATLTAITGIASSSVILASGGIAVVAILVIASAWRIVKEKKKAYKGLMLVMDELYLVLQKMNGILDVSMHIAETYGFPIDTRDVNIALNTIMVKFDELLEPTDLVDIKKDLSNFKQLKQTFDSQATAVADELVNLQAGQDDPNRNDPPKLTLFTWLNNQKKQIFFSAPEFIEELNEAVAYLSLYFAALAASFSTTYTTVVVQLIVDGKTADLKRLQAKMLEANQFHSMLEGALVYPLLQSQKTYATCKLKNLKDSSCDATFETAATNSLKYMKNKFDNYSAGGSELYKKMIHLKKLVDSPISISNVDEATNFAKAVKKARDDDSYATDVASAPSKDLTGQVDAVTSGIPNVPVLLADPSLTVDPNLTADTSLTVGSAAAAPVSSGSGSADPPVSSGSSTEAAALPALPAGSGSSTEAAALPAAPVGSGSAADDEAAAKAEDEARAARTAKIDAQLQAAKDASEARRKAQQQSTASTFPKMQTGNVVGAQKITPEKQGIAAGVGGSRKRRIRVRGSRTSRRRIHTLTPEMQQPQQSGIDK